MNPAYKPSHSPISSAGADVYSGPSVWATGLPVYARIEAASFLYITSYVSVSANYKKDENRRDPTRYFNIFDGFYETPRRIPHTEEPKRAHISTLERRKGYKWQVVLSKNHFSAFREDVQNVFGVLRLLRRPDCRLGVRATICRHPSTHTSGRGDRTPGDGLHNDSCAGDTDIYVYRYYIGIKYTYIYYIGRYPPIRTADDGVYDGAADAIPLLLLAPSPLDDRHFYDIRLFIDDLGVPPCTREPALRRIYVRSVRSRLLVFSSLRCGGGGGVQHFFFYSTPLCSSRLRL